MTFKKLYTSQAFRFASESGVDGLTWQGARGPWVKVGPSSYRALVDGYASGPAHRVGTQSVKVAPQA